MAIEVISISDDEEPTVELLETWSRPGGPIQHNGLSQKLNSVRASEHRHASATGRPATTCIKIERERGIHISAKRRKLFHNVPSESDRLRNRTRLDDDDNQDYTAVLSVAPRRYLKSDLNDLNRSPSPDGIFIRSPDSVPYDSSRAIGGRFPRRDVPQPATYDVRAHTLDKESVPEHNAEHSSSTYGRITWSVEETTHLMKIKMQGLSWPEIAQHFPSRTEKAITARYYKCLNSQDDDISKARKDPQPLTTDLDNEDSSASGQPRRRRLVRRTKSGRETSAEADTGTPEETTPDAEPRDEFEDGVVQPMLTLAHCLRCRELGAPARKGREATCLTLRQAATTSYSVSKIMDGASGDVCTVAWSSDGKFFAAGAVAISDPHSMQYNLPNNLLIGHINGTIKELPDHHIPRPIATKGPNALASMRETQDPRVFTTVQMVAFSPDQHMFSASMDGALNVYSTAANDIADTRLVARREHDAPINCLAASMHFQNTVAIGRKSTKGDSVSVLSLADEHLKLNMNLGTDSRNEIYPFTVKWGVTSAQQNYLLVGFAQDKAIAFDDDDNIDALGATCLFDVQHQTSIYVDTPKCAVFDLAWNPNPTGRSAFAVASVAEHYGRAGTFSNIRLFSRHQQDMHHVMELDCPARDINDVVYCPYDDNLIAAGSTDGKVFIWDTRWYKKSETPQRRYRHGDCLSVLAHEYERWEVDTGVRFLAWGQDATMLYTASSDGVVKCWNPYLDSNESHIEDIATFKSNVMSGAFTQDFSKLLIGEDRGRISLLDLGPQDEMEVGAESKFDFLRAPEPSEGASQHYHEHLLNAGIIELKPMGALPVRQAVQGPNYRDQALENVFSQAADEDVDVLEAEYAVIQARAEDAASRPQAEWLQGVLRAQRNEWKKVRSIVGHDVKACGLDCGFKPHDYADDEEDTQVVDSGRASDRIPSQLRSAPPTGLEKLRLGLHAVCRKCGRPARPNDHRDNSAADESDGAAEILCELCRFACLRCGHPAVVAKDRMCISCGDCRLSWRADCLGYYLVDDAPQPADATSRAAHARRVAANTPIVDQDMPLNKIGFCSWAKEEVMDELDGTVYWTTEDV